MRHINQYKYSGLQITTRVQLYHFLYILCNLFLNISLCRLDFVFCEGTGKLSCTVMCVNSSCSVLR